MWSGNHVLATEAMRLRPHFYRLYAGDCAGCSLKPRCTTAEAVALSAAILHEDAHGTNECPLSPESEPDPPAPMRFETPASEP